MLIPHAHTLPRSLLPTHANTQIHTLHKYTHARMHIHPHKHTLPRGFGGLGIRPSQRSHHLIQQNDEGHVSGNGLIDQAFMVITSASASHHTHTRHKHRGEQTPAHTHTHTRHKHRGEQTPTHTHTRHKHRGEQTRAGGSASMYGQREGCVCTVFGSVSRRKFKSPKRTLTCVCI